MKFIQLKNIIFGCLAIALLIFVVDVYCPLETIFGIPCPGCGMSTALYYVLRLDFATAIYFHPMVLVCILYFMGIGIVYLKYHTFQVKIVKIFTIIFVGLLIITYIYRMINIFPEYPMLYNENSILGRIIK